MADKITETASLAAWFHAQEWETVWTVPLPPTPDDMPEDGNDILVAVNGSLIALLLPGSETRGYTNIDVTRSESAEAARETARESVAHAVIMTYLTNSGVLDIVGLPDPGSPAMCDLRGTVTVHPDGTWEHSTHDSNIVRESTPVSRYTV